MLSCIPAYVYGAHVESNAGLVALVALLCLPLVVLAGWYGPVILHTSCPYDMMACVSGCRRTSNYGYASVTPLPQDEVDDDQFEDAGIEFESGFEDELEIES